MMKEHPLGTSLHIHVQPGAKISQISGRHGEALKLKIKAPPVDGKANLAVIDFFSSLFKVPKSSVRILKGESSRQKVVLIEGLPLNEIDEILKKKLSSL